MMFKTKFLKLNFVPKIQLGNCIIDYVEKVKYLGFPLTCDLRDDIDMYRQLRYVMVQQINFVVNSPTVLKT